VFGAFLLLYLGPVRAQRCGEMDACWIRHFPDWERPWQIPLWLLSSTFEVFRYQLMPFGQVFAVLAAIGLVGWFRRCEYAVALLLSLPLMLALVAAFLGKYPYGGSRLEMYALPSVLLLVGNGLEALVRWRPAAPFALRHLGLLLAIIPTGYTAYHLVVPWKRVNWVPAYEYVHRHGNADEAVVIGCWEYRYYFRHHGPHVFPIEQTIRQPETVPNLPTWVMVHKKARFFFEKWIEVHRPDWTVSHRYQSNEVEVLYLQPSGSQVVGRDPVRNR
jgi:hypothetical protein